MTNPDKPLTRRELARVLRVVAHFLENAETAANDTASRRVPRKAKPSLEPPSELTRARARATLRKLGVLP